MSSANKQSSNKKDSGHRIQITHNPFIVQTSFLINGQPPAEGCKLSSYRELRLQRWVETLFNELNDLFNGDNHYQITFTGVESDYLDILAAAEAAKAQDMRIELEWTPSDSSENR